MSDNQFGSNILPTNVISALHDNLIGLMETITWGKATKQSILTLEDIQNWFHDINFSKKRKAVLGAAIRINEAGSTQIRVYQGIFDKNLKCITARQLFVKEISSELEELFSKNEMLVFLENKELLEKYLSSKE